MKHRYVLIYWINCAVQGIGFAVLIGRHHPSIAVLLVATALMFWIGWQQGDLVFKAVYEGRDE